MQNRYVGDVGDFGKYGLLRRLSGYVGPGDAPRLRIGIVWYLVPDECGNADGKHVGYLRPTRGNHRDFRACDPRLWESLRDFVDRDVRCVHCVQGAGLLPAGSAFFDAPLVFPPGLGDRDLRERLRTRWMAEALRAVRDTDLVCLDPDNGLSRPDRMYRKEGPKYTYRDDLRSFWERGQSLVVYHHLGMDRRADVQIPEAADRLQEAVGVSPIPLRFRRGSARVFFVLPQPAVRPVFERRARVMLAGPWGQHFEWGR